MTTEAKSTGKCKSCGWENTELDSEGNCESCEDTATFPEDIDPVLEEEIRFLYHSFELERQGDFELVDMKKMEQIRLKYFPQSESWL